MSILQGLLQFRQVVSDTVVNQAAQITQAAEKQELNLWELTMKGGIIMIPIFVLSIIGVYIIIERYITIKKASQEDESFMINVRNYISQGKLSEAIALCKSNQTPVARMIEKGISRIGRPLSDVSAAIENVGNLETIQLEKRLSLLATVSGAAPMIGFLGTVTGMISAFYDMANAEGGNLNISLLSNGIYEAMVTTVAGLVVGIIAYLGYNLLVSYVNKVVYMLELRSTEFMDLLNEPVN